MKLLSVDEGAAGTDGDRRRWFMEFAHRIDQLNTAVDLLVLCRKATSWGTIMQYCHECGIPTAQRSAAVRFLVRQRLLIRTQKPPQDYDYREGIYKAVPKAVDELVYRLAHNGEPSPAPEPPDPDMARQAARDKLTAALAGAGYHDKAGRRLRVVR